ncbi:MAG: hypothetical protein NVSMB22_00390 [Chloroflexota bacterium]
MSVIGSLAFVAAMVALTVVWRASPESKSAPDVRDYPDTTALGRELVRATEKLAEEELALADARDRAGRPIDPPSFQSALTVAATPHTTTRRDTLERGVLELGRAINRAENAPLASSYRALATTGPLRDDPAVKALVDSLSEIERIRDAFGALGGVDPIYVSLTGRATAVGRAIQSIALTKRADFRRQIAALQEPEEIPDTLARAHALRLHEIAVTDSLAYSVAVDSARYGVSVASDALSQGRAAVARLDKQALLAREAATRRVPIWALLAAALIFAFVCGFVAVFLSEVRHPHVGDTGELARLAGVPCTAVQLPPSPPRDRSRRRADRDIPPLLSWRADDYQLLYLQMAVEGGTLLFATVTGDHSGVTAAVAGNLAAAAVRQARTAVVADVDVEDGVVADVLRVRRSPGVREIVTSGRSWAEAIVSAPIGRDLIIDIVPSGARGTLGAKELSARLAPEVARLSRRYDAVVVACSTEQALSGLASALPVPDVILCARAGHTRLRDLSVMVDGLRLAGGRLRATVLWHGDPPAAPSSDSLTIAAKGDAHPPRPTEERGV